MPMRCPECEPTPQASISGLGTRAAVRGRLACANQRAAPHGAAVSWTGWPCILGSLWFEVENFQLTTWEAVTWWRGDAIFLPEFFPLKVRRGDPKRKEPLHRCAPPNPLSPPPLTSPSWRRQPIFIHSADSRSACWESHDPAGVELVERTVSETARLQKCLTSPGWVESW